jgi:hypothetical protein
MCFGCVCHDRKFTLVGVVMLFPRRSVSQLVVAVAISGGFLTMHVAVKPFKTSMDNVFRTTTELHVFITVCLALALRHDLQYEGHAEQTFEHVMFWSFVLLVPCALIATVAAKAWKLRGELERLDKDIEKGTQSDETHSCRCCPALRKDEQGTLSPAKYRARAFLLLQFGLASLAERECLERWFEALKRSCIVVSCPEKGSSKAVVRGEVMKYDEEVMEMVKMLQDLGVVKFAFDRAGTTTKCEEDVKNNVDFTKPEEVRKSRWFQGYRSAIKKALAIEAQHLLPGEAIEVICIEGGTISRTEAEEMPTILEEAKKDAKMSNIDLRATYDKPLSYREFLEQYHPFHPEQARKHAKSEGTAVTAVRGRARLRSTVSLAVNGLLFVSGCQEPLRLSEMLRRARDRGVPECELDKAVDSDDPKAEVRKKMIEWLQPELSSTSVSGSVEPSAAMLHDAPENDRRPKTNQPRERSATPLAEAEEEAARVTIDSEEGVPPVEGL